MKITHPTTKLRPAEIAQIVGCSLRMAYAYAKEETPLPASAARDLEKATGISRLHLLFPAEFDGQGYRISPQAEEAQANGS